VRSLGPTPIKGLTEAVPIYELIAAGAARTRLQASLARGLTRSGIAKILRVELCIAATPEQGPLGGCGLIVVNPPWTLPGELSAMLPVLTTILAGKGGSHRLDWLVEQG